MNNLKHFLQRGIRGYSDRDAWDISAYLGKIIPDLVRSLKDGNGCPSEYYDKKAVNNECHKWKDILEEIAQGFEAANHINSLSFYKNIKNKDGTYSYKIDKKALQNAEKKMEKGLQLFIKNYLNLWD